MYIRTGLAPISDESAHDQSKKSKKILDILTGRYSAPKSQNNRKYECNTPKKRTQSIFLYQKIQKKILIRQVLLGCYVWVAELTGQMGEWFFRA